MNHDTPTDHAPQPTPVQSTQIHRNHRRSVSRTGHCCAALRQTRSVVDAHQQQRRRVNGTVNVAAALRFETTAAAFDRTQELVRSDEPPNPQANDHPLNIYPNTRGTHPNRRPQPDNLIQEASPLINNRLPHKQQLSTLVYWSPNPKTCQNRSICRQLS